MRQERVRYDTRCRARVDRPSSRLFILYLDLVCELRTSHCSLSCALATAPLPAILFYVFYLYYFILSA